MHIFHTLLAGYLPSVYMCTYVCMPFLLSNLCIQIMMQSITLPQSFPTHLIIIVSWYCSVLFCCGVQLPNRPLSVHWHNSRYVFFVLCPFVVYTLHLSAFIILVGSLSDIFFFFAVVYLPESLRDKVSFVFTYRL